MTLLTCKYHWSKVLYKMINLNQVFISLRKKNFFLQTDILLDIAKFIVFISNFVVAEGVDKTPF